MKIPKPASARDPESPLARALRSALDAPARAGRSSHPSEDELARYLRRELSPDERDRFESHVAGCASCSEELVLAVQVEDDAARAAGAAPDVAGAVAPHPRAAGRPAAPAARSAAYRPRRSGRRIWMRIAAGAVLVTGTVLLAAAGSRIVLGKLQPMLLDGLAGLAERDVSGGGASLVLASGPGVRLEAVAIAEDPRFGGGEFARATAATLRLDPGALLRGRVRGAIHLDEPRVQLIRNDRGQWNVETLAGGRVGAAVRAGDLPGAERQAREREAAGARAKERLVRLTSASIADGTLEISDHLGDGSELVLRGVDLRYSSPDPHAPAALDLVGRVGDDAGRVAFRGEIGPFEGAATPRYRFPEVVLQSLPLERVPGAPVDVSGELTFDGELASSGSGYDAIVRNASGAGDLGLCCGALHERNLAAELLASIGADAGAAGSPGAVLEQAAQSPAIASVLAQSATPFEEISGRVTIAGGSLGFSDLAVASDLFRATATGSLSSAGALDARGSVTLSPAVSAAVADALPGARMLLAQGKSIEVPFTVTGTWPDVRVEVDVVPALASLARPLDPRRLLLALRVAG